MVMYQIKNRLKKSMEYSWDSLGENQEGST